MPGGDVMPPLPLPLADAVRGATAEPVLAGEAGATVLRLTDPDGSIRYLKHGSGRVAEDIGDEWVRLRWLRGRMPCAEPLYFTQVDGSAWLLTAAVAGRTGDEWLTDEPERLGSVIDAFAAYLRRLHALPIDDCPFDAGADVRLAAARRNLAAGLVDTDDFDDDHAGWSAERMWGELIRLRPPLGGPRVVTHGDFSLGNLLLDGSGAVTAAIDVGRLGVADPYQDITIFWQNLGEFGEAAQRRFLGAMGIDEADEQRLAFHRCLDEMF